MHGLADDAAGATGRDGIPDAWNARRHDDAAPMAAPRLRSLFECLGEVPEFRKARGRRHPLETVLTIAVAARLAGCRGVTAFARFAALLPQERPEAAGAFFSPSRQRHTAPSITTFHNILADLPPDTLDEAIGRWTAQRAGAGTPLAMDGKDVRGASRQTEDGRRMTVAAAGHGTGLVLRQVEVEDKSNEIPAVRALSGSLDVTGRVVTVDAMHARHVTARSLLARRADHVVTAARDSQETIHDDPGAIDFTGAPSHETVDKGHGRLERRRCATVDPPAPNGTASPPFTGAARPSASNASARSPGPASAAARRPGARLARPGTRRAGGASRAGAQPLDHGEPRALRARLHL